MNTHNANRFSTGKQTVGNTISLQLAVKTDSDYPVHKIRQGITILADANNAGTVFVMNSANSNATTGGFPLKAGASLLLALDALDIIWLLADTGGANLVSWIAI